jgi:hypothetical protein
MPRRHSNSCDTHNMCGEPTTKACAEFKDGTITQWQYIQVYSATATLGPGQVFMCHQMASAHPSTAFLTPQTQALSALHRRSCSNHSKKVTPSTATKATSGLPHVLPCMQHRTVPTLECPKRHSCSSCSRCRTPNHQKGNKSTPESISCDCQLRKAHLQLNTFMPPPDQNTLLLLARSLG